MNSYTYFIFTIPKKNLNAISKIRYSIWSIMANFYERLSYSFGNEDWSTEQRALKITPKDSIVCVTASGDRPLNLLTANCKDLLSIDANPIQNYLLNLKCAALAEFDYDNYLAFIGIQEHSNRLRLFGLISERLDLPTKAFWSRQKKMIEKGVIYQGKIERMLFWASKAIQMLRGSKVDELLAFDDLEQQKAFVNTVWESPSWKKSFEFALNPFFSRMFVKDPGLYLAVDSSISPGLYIHQRLNSYLNHHLAKKSPLLCLLLKGKVVDEALPPYLMEQGTTHIRSSLNRLTAKTANFVDYLEAHKTEKFDCFSVSDVASYLTAPDFERLIAGIYQTAKPGARFCMRQFLSGHQIPEKYLPHFQRDLALEDELQKQDNCFVYRFVTGTIVKQL